MSGAGNDFVVVDNRKHIIADSPSFAINVCDHRWGIGADGLLLLEISEIADYRMMYYNADGSYGGMCGNGGRCIARFAHQYGIAAPNHSFEALEYVYKVMIQRDMVSLSMKDPKDLQFGVMLQIPSFDSPLITHLINTGSPHVVVPISNLPDRLPLEEIEVAKLGRDIRMHEQFAPIGTNVNFIEVFGANHIKVRTYERGVEDETLSCGTGAVAVAIIANFIWNLESPIQIIPSSGIKLSVSFERVRDDYRNIKLEGPAVEIFSGVIERKT